MSSSIFRQIRRQRLPRSGFDLSHNKKLTADMGKLYPILFQDVVPGDTFRLNTSIFCRLAPMIAPMMSRVNIYTYYFFVPKRLVWSHWKDFITGQPQDESRINAIESEVDGTYTPPEYPYFVVTNKEIEENPTNIFRSGSLADYLGFPVFDKNNQDGRFVDQSTAIIHHKLDALPFRAYHLICNEYFRDQNVEKPYYLHLDDDGQQPTERGWMTDLLTMRYKCWKKDYFTSALPFPQAGPDVELPLSGNASVLTNDPLEIPIEMGTPSQGGIAQAAKTTTGEPIRERSTHKYLYEDSTGITGSDSGPLSNLNVSNGRLHTRGAGSGDPLYAYLDVPRNSITGRSMYVVDPSEIASRLGVDMSSVSSATINELRRAFAAQRFLEAEARGGSRYIEELYNIFGVRSSDGRQQRPIYLGGGKQPIVVSDVLQTSSTDSTSPQGNQSGTGASLGRSGGFKRNFEEHGYVIGLMCILPDASYQQGFPRMFQKFDRLDHYWPQFAHLGEQEIRKSELYYTGRVTAHEGDTFGYTPRYAEYKYCPDTIHGEFRDSLSFWHLGRIFDSSPGLNRTFLHASPSRRVFAVTDSKTDHFWFNVQHDLKAIRSMPKFGTPI